MLILTTIIKVIKRNTQRSKTNTWAALFAIGYKADWAYTDEGQDPGPDWQTTSAHRTTIY